MALPEVELLRGEHLHGLNEALLVGALQVDAVESTLHEVHVHQALLELGQVAGISPHLLATQTESTL